MTQEEKELLLKDLCARLPYGVKFGIGSAKLGRYDLTDIDVKKEKVRYSNGLYADLERCKPYLRPMSSMTEEEKRHISKMMCLRTYDNGVVYDMTYPVYTPYYVMEDCLSYLCSIHVDYSGLIKKGLAVEVTKENNPYEQNKS